MLHVQLRDRRLAPRPNVSLNRCISSYGSIMGKTQKVDGSVASTPRLLDNDREGHQPLHRTTTQTHNMLKIQ
jgi:hypothetical protein